MPSLIAWLDASSEEQRRMRDIIRLFAERESRDELGLGQIRDAIADSLFPGTSTLLTRARYLLFVPWAYRKASGRPNPTADVDRYERDIIHAVRDSGDYAGLLGMQAGEALKNLPSAIYWSMLRHYGILTDASLSREDALRLDLYSPLLQEFHRRLWSKQLPNGEVFELIPERVGRVHTLRYSAPGSEFTLSSDTLANSSRGTRRSFYEAMGPVENERWHREGGSIGGRLIFPRNRIDGKQTINQQRGTHARIRDRFDLTLEAIRRHYAAVPSPLSETLARYSDFFALYGDFDGYVNFFLLQDLVDEQGSVRFYGPFDEYAGPVLPDTMDEYRTFRQGQLDFVAARNGRILQQVAHSD